VDMYVVDSIRNSMLFPFNIRDLLLSEVWSVNPSPTQDFELGFGA
jgi:hypothetical protein